MNKKGMKYLACLVIILSLCSFTRAQTENEVKVIHQLGLHAGSTTGIGLSYRFWPGRLGFQVTLLPFKNNAEQINNGDNDRFNPFSELEFPRGQFVSLGLTALSTVKQFGKSKMFAYWGNHLLLLDDESIYSTGIGIGFFYEAPVCFNLMLGYGAYDITNSLLLLPAAEIGVYYRFRNKN